MLQNPFPMAVHVSLMYIHTLHAYVCTCMGVLIWCTCVHNLGNQQANHTGTNVDCSFPSQPTLFFVPFKHSNIHYRLSIVKDSCTHYLFTNSLCVDEKKKKKKKEPPNEALVSIRPSAMLFVCVFWMLCSDQISFHGSPKIHESHESQMLPYKRRATMGRI